MYVASVTTSKKNNSSRHSFGIDTLDGLKDTLMSLLAAAAVSLWSMTILMSITPNLMYWRMPYSARYRPLDSRSFL